MIYILQGPNRNGGRSLRKQLLRQTGSLFGSITNLLGASPVDIVPDCVRQSDEADWVMRMVRTMCRGSHQSCVRD